MAKGFYTNVGGVMKKLTPYIAKKKKVPTEYTELVYIASSGIQYIDLGIIPSVNTKVELIIGNTTVLVSGDNGIFGNNNFGVRWNALNILRGGIGTASWQNTTVEQQENNTIILSKDTATYNGNTLTVGRASSYLTSKTAYLFAFNNGTKAIGTNVSIMSCKIYNGDIIVADLVAVKRKADSVLGMYDFVSKTMLTNAGTGTFIEGPEKKETRLPDEYQEVEYITNKANSWIDTDYIPQLEDVVTTYVKPKSGQFVFGGAETNGMGLWSVGSSGNSSWGNVVGTVFYSYFDSANFNKVVMSKTGVEINDVQKVTWSATSMTATDNLLLFRSQRTSYFGVGVTFKSFDITRDNQKVMEMVPCYRKVDSVAGFYDIVRSTFYSNAGTGEGFTVGPNVNAATAEVAVNANPLPAGYQEVEYLQSTGVQYIDTNFYANQDTTIEMDVLITERREQLTGSAFFGARNASKNDCFAALDFKNVMCSSYKNYSNVTTTVSTASNVKYNVSLQKNKLYIDRVAETVHTYGTFTGERSIYLFGWNSAATSGFDADQSLIGRIYNCKILDNGTSALNLVPCYRKSDNKPGMYDLVNSAFLTNGGTGDDFTVGPDVGDDNYTRIEHAWVWTGTAWVDILA